MPRGKAVYLDGVVEAIRVADRPFVSTGELAEHFDVTRQTIRDNLDRIKDDERIEVTRVNRSSFFYFAGMMTDTTTTMNHGTQTEIESATVTSVVPYADTPELRTYTADSITELTNLILNLQIEQVAERIVDVDIE